MNQFNIFCYKYGCFQIAECIDSAVKGFLESADKTALQVMYDYQYWNMLDLWDSLPPPTTTTTTTTTTQQQQQHNSCEKSYM